MSTLVCVSNRVMNSRQAAQAGGVAVALADVMQATRGVWFGWSGAVGGNPAAVSTTTDTRGATLVTVPMTKPEHEGFYLGYANSVLWPVFHNRIDLAKFEAGYFSAYASFNRRMAEILAPMLKPDDTIWVHDYHFMLMAQELRRLGVRNRIGFFLHITMPPSEVYQAIPEHRQLSKGLAAFDLVGLQTSHDADNARACLRASIDADPLSDGRLQAGSRTFAVEHFPIGIDAAYFQPKKPIARPATPDVIRVLGVDRLDYSKGLPQKFRAFQRFLEKYPDWKQRVQLTQIAAPTRESIGAYTSIRRELEGLSGAVNGAYGDLDWVPIQYIHRATGRRKLGEIYRGSRIALVTPLSDGMNLMAKEYVAAQDPADPGVLVLSQFAGAAEQLPSALVVNPHNLDEIADALNRAVMMGLPERKWRHAAMLKSVCEESSDHWWRSFVTRLRQDERQGAAYRPPDKVRV